MALQSHLSSPNSPLPLTGFSRVGTKMVSPHSTLAHVSSFVTSFSTYRILEAPHLHRGPSQLELHMHVVGVHPLDAT